ncbi:MAG TPA: NUDIX domain-containing protein [Tepidisphaeraceae bacterium]|jgi:8-oxo-dGTP pyrophosphatase MutT (NUDIX family)|nr:NUDIX domain-containing protein [Tepidisphaeraceae bacterium]
MKIRYDMVSCYVTRPAAEGTGHEFLQLRRSKDDYMGGTWQAIYGTSEPGESPVAAALRELREEAGLIPQEFYRLDQVSVFYIASADTLWHCVPFCAIVTREQSVILNDEHDAARWVPAGDAERAFMWKDNRDAIRDIASHLLVESLAKPYLRIPLPGIGGDC